MTGGLLSATTTSSPPPARRPRRPPAPPRGSARWHRRAADPDPAARPQRAARAADHPGRRDDRRPGRRARCCHELQRGPGQPPRAARGGDRALRQRRAAADRHLLRAGHHRARHGAARRPHHLATINVADSTSIDPSNLSPAQLGVPGADITLLQPVLERSADDLDPGDRRDRARGAGPQDEGGGRLTQHALDVTITLGGQNVLDLTVGEARSAPRRQLRRRRRPRAPVHVAPDRADRRAALQGQGAAVRRRQPALRGPAGEDPLHRLRQGRRAPARAPDRAVPGHRAAAAAEDPRHQQGPLPRRDRQGEELAAQARAADARLEHEGKGAPRHDRRADRAPARPPVREVVVKRRLSCGSYRVVKRFKPPRQRRASASRSPGRRAARRPPTGSRRACASTPATRRCTPRSRCRGTSTSRSS